MTDEMQGNSDQRDEVVGPPDTPARRGFSGVAVVVAGLVGLLIGMAAGGLLLGGEGDDEQAAAEPSSSPVAFEYRNLGEPATTGLGNEVTVFAFDETDLPPGTTTEDFSAWKADVEWCADPRQPAVPVNGVAGRFFLLLSNDVERVPASTVDVAPPGYLSASQGVVGPGECMRGWIRFAAPPDAEPQFVSFAGASLVRWHVSETSGEQP